MKPAYRIKAVDPFDDDDAAEDILTIFGICMPNDEQPDIAVGHWWLAYDPAGLPVAYAGLYQSRRYSNVGYLCSAGVLPDARGHGLQRRLVAVRERKARANGWGWMVTDTVPSNPASSNTLIRCGYRTYVPERPWRVTGAIFWRKTL